MTGPLPRRFYFVAASAGFAFANMAISVPLHVVETGGKAGVAGSVLAVATASVALGALLAGRLGRRRRSLLTIAAGVIGGGALMLATAAGVPLLAAGSCVVGLGIGVFWVASQLVLSRRAGRPEGARDFLLHYAVYTVGAVAGAGATGALASGAGALGVGALTGIRVASLLAVSGSILAVLAWRRSLAERVEPAALPAPEGPPERQLKLQVPDLLLVAALALLLPLAPVVLAREFGLAPLSIGLVMGGVSLAKIAGTFVARLITRGSGPRRTILLLLGAGASFCVLLAMAITLSVFVAALFATALAGTGAWPLVVDAAQARVEPASRRALTVHWNAREYVLIAAATAVAGWLITALGTPVPVFVLAALLFFGAATTAAAQLRRPVWRPVVSG